ncbi:hypothetical protein QE369_004774 [Agrobacterium larrymoorei]|uniref:Uncharacterized protein n=1 Tax=Agrobacterium larrymoorei TaxID=160699 RepID=A0AAJ2EXE2_9HYPH|nr:hypothetical protein [Agrobacterium larrymoorei]MDR6104577.1 hypothetical protein [Agrobacterium larrymoorei]
MADIISISTATRRPHKRTEADAIAAGPAQLLFFTGVRYERCEFADKTKTRKRKVSGTASSEAALTS